MKITRIKVRSYRGIEALDAEIPPHGAIAAGRNGSGKTSILLALRAALAAQDVAPDAIRLGAARAEIFIDLDDISVRRVIRKSGRPDLEVTTREGDTKKKPRTLLTELFGTSILDPLDLLLAPPKECRARVLAALPVSVTVAQLRRYVPELPDHWDVSGHAIEAIGRLKDYIYAKRTTANAEAAERRRQAEEAAINLVKYAAAVPPGPTLSLAEAEAAAEEASSAFLSVQASALEAGRATERTAKSRARVGEVLAHAKAAQERSQDRPDPARRAEVEASNDCTRAQIVRLQGALADAQQQLLSGEATIRAMDRAEAEADRARAEADALRTQADELERTIAESSAPPVAPNALAAAERRLSESRAVLENAKKAEALASARGHAESAESAAKEAETYACTLDSYVRALADRAPVELLTGGGLMAGLAIDGAEVLLDGKRLGALSGAEQMRFCLDMAKRLNAKSKILVVDGLERLDAEQYPAFVAEATRDGWQLIGSRVDRGELVLEAIASEEG